MSKKGGVFLLSSLANQPRRLTLTVFTGHMYSNPGEDLISPTEPEVPSQVTFELSNKE
jgi:hypothetical protein